MANSFDPKNQVIDLTSKIVVGVERLSEVLRVLLWEKSKETGLSPIQIQLLLFIRHHDSSLANVSHLSKEFNLKKPTISDAIKVLHEKKLIEKEKGEDARGYTILLSPSGRRLVDTLQGFEAPLRESIDTLDKHAQEELYTGLVKMIFGLNQSRIIDVQRTCFGCSFYEKQDDGHFCQFIKKQLSDSEIRLDCEDFKALAH
ncbi:MarR family winged helix-turn-helix transcriptional regulator [Ekhidna sp. To15]|uniref:MarR family winged helix-turn-helix transcriptional regulator n=1 Tax=Ekhidna sp. To15 TaxID=3395267 RepID=UPI003F5217A5